MRRVIALALVLTACSGSTRTLSGVLDDIPGDVNQIVSSLDFVLARPVAIPTEFYAQISDLRLSATAGALYDQVSRLEGAGVETALARYTAFIGDLLLATGDLDAAVAAANPAGIALSWLRIEAGAGSLAVGLDPAECPVVVPLLVAGLCRPEGQPGYDAGVELTIRRFVGRYRPVMRLPAAFDDAVAGQIAIVVAPEVIASIDDALADLATLNPPDSHVGVHASFVDSLLALRTIWSAATAGEYATAEPAVDAAIGIDWPTLEADLVEAACDGSIRFVEGRVSLQAAEPASPIAALGALWFYGEGIGCP